MIHTLPTPSPSAISWTPESAVATSESPFSFRRQTYDHGGQRNRVTLDLPTMSASEGKEWQAFFRKINGMAGEFYVYPVSLADPLRGTTNGMLAVDGAGQTGGTLNATGFMNNEINALRAGDWVSIGDRLHTITQDVDSDATGKATLNIWPNISTAHADLAAIEIHQPRGVFRLSSPSPTLTLSPARLYSGISFEAVESL